MLDQIDPRLGANQARREALIDAPPAKDAIAPAARPRVAPADLIPAVESEPYVDLGLVAPTTLTSPPPRRKWERRLVRDVVMADVLTVLLASLLTLIVRVQSASQSIEIASMQVPYVVVGLAIIPVWIAFLAIGGAYDPSLLGDSADEYSKVATSAAALLTAVCAASFIGSVALSRGLLAVFFVGIMGIGILNRFVVRKALHRNRGEGVAMRKIVVVGDRNAVSHLTMHLKRAAFAGYEVVGAYVPGGQAPEPDADPELPFVHGAPDQLVADLDLIEIDAIAVTGHDLFETESLRSLAWRLHGTGIQLLMAPDLVDIAGPRIVSRPAGGLPMLLVEEPRTTGPAQFTKSVVERVMATALLLLVAPLVAVIALLVKLTSRGPVFFHQVRIGRDGRPFRMIKFRSMVAGAEMRRDSLLDRNEHDGLLFKIKDDPRVTAIGRHLRRYSLDELPQLWNVVRGDMALIGPRPPLPSEVARYGGDIGRRLMVKPGITGLWQVSGRADMSWTEAVRLDLYYVENWSLALDITILAKTAKTVLSGHGAY